MQSQQNIEQIKDKIDAIQRHMDGKRIFAIDIKKRVVYGMHQITLRDMEKEELIYFELTTQEPEEIINSSDNQEEAKWQEA
ncbi:MAG: hypothetical protein HFI34_06915 [Lachnospiraceae bacterium]|nr:hypothetical protein [Lachnospiraceae bacterium]